MSNLTQFYEASQRLSEEEALKLFSKLTNCVVASRVTQDEDEDRWVQERLLGIGGSDVGSICGVNKYSSARLTYLIKTGQYEPKFSEEAKERMAWGHKLEPIVADEFTERTGKRVVIAPATFVHKDFPWARANVDRFIVDDDGNPIGVLECKTADSRLNQLWADGEIPMSYIYQLTWYLWITGFTYGAFAALVGGNKFYYYEVYFNKELFEEDIFPYVDKFWNYNIANLIEPDISGTDADTEYVNTTNLDVEKGTIIEINEDEFEEAAKEIILKKAEVARLNKEIALAQNKFKDKLGTTESARTPNFDIKWSKVTQKRVSSDLLKSNFPEVYEKVVVESSYRKMTIKGDIEDDY